MLETFEFCPASNVPVTVPPEAQSVTTMNGWTFSSRPNVPYCRKFKVKLQGLRWYLQSGGYYDKDTNPAYNAHRLEKFYQRHQQYKPFRWFHQHLGLIEVRFAAPVELPAGIENSGGLLEAYEITLIEHNPGWSNA